MSLVDRHGRRLMPIGDSRLCPACWTGRVKAFGQWWCGRCGWETMQP